MAITESVSGEGREGEGREGVPKHNIDEAIVGAPLLFFVVLLHTRTNQPNQRSFLP